MMIRTITAARQPCSWFYSTGNPDHCNYFLQEQSLVRDSRQGVVLLQITTERLAGHEH